MKYFWLISGLYCAGLLSLNESDNLSKLQAQMTTLRVADNCWQKEQSGDKTEKISLAFINETGIPLKIRGRLGGDPAKDTPATGYICSVDNENAPQIFVLQNGEGIRFNINESDFPLRVRTWQIDFTPDDDMENEVPINTSEKNEINTIVGMWFNLSEQEYQIKHGKYIAITYDKQSYDFISKDIDKNAPLKEGYTRGYIPKKKRK